MDVNGICSTLWHTLLGTNISTQKFLQKMNVSNSCLMIPSRFAGKWPQNSLKFGIFFGKRCGQNILPPSTPDRRRFWNGCSQHKAIHSCLVLVGKLGVFGDRWDMGTVKWVGVSKCRHGGGGSPGSECLRVVGRIWLNPGSGFVSCLLGE